MFKRKPLEAKSKIILVQRGRPQHKKNHQVALSRKKRNKLIRIKIQSDSWVEGQDGICEVVRDYFVNLFEAPTVSMDNFQFIERAEGIISLDQNEELIRPFKVDEFKRAIF